MNTFITELKQRKYDGKWVLWEYRPDPTQNITDEDWKGREMFYPWRWIASKVFDWEIILEG